METRKRASVIMPANPLCSKLLILVLFYAGCDAFQTRRTNSASVVPSIFPSCDSVVATTSANLRMASTSAEMDHLNEQKKDDGEEDDDAGFQFSKSKWKKKRFLMIKDVNAAVSRKQAKAVTKAEEMVRRMWTLYEKSGEPEFRPDLQCYNLWIHAIAKSNPRGRHMNANERALGRRAEAVLDEMRERGIDPNIVSYTTVMDAYANQARHGDLKAPAEAERILFDLLERSEHNPNLQVTAVTSDTVINAWAQQGTWEGAEHAQQILDRLEVIELPSSQNTGGEPVRPTAHSYASVIYAWSNSGGGADAARKAHDILDRLLESKEKGSVKPDTVVFNAVIAAWASSGDPQCGTKAVEILRQMQDLCKGVKYDCQPDVVTYNSVLSAWSRSGHINAAVQAERILKDMILSRKEDPETNPAPNVISYNTVLNAWSKSSLDGASDRAETLLKVMARTDQGDLVPDVYSYSSVLNAIAKSKQPGKALRAKNLLEHMLEESRFIKHSELTPVPFNAVMNAAAFSAVGTCDEEKREALQVAVSTFALMRKLNVMPDTISYGNMLKALANLMQASKSRYDMAVQLFMDCCEAGLVEELAWNEVQRCVPMRFLSERLDLDLNRSTQPLRLRDLPRSWRRNSRAATRRRRVQPAKPELSSSTGDDSDSSSPFRRQIAISEPSYQSGRDM